jgi:hypothetical protein
MLRYLALSLFIGCSTAVLASEPEITTLEQDAAALAQRFVSQLKPQLQQAMADGGPTLAIEVCSSMAPRIADSLSAESGWLVKRVSLKSRNASRGQPDKWERQVLQQFDKRQQAGEAAKAINHGETRGTQYRYMQAQGVEAVCLVCHGENLAQPVRATLEQYYPDDWATGYSLGQVRGAISLAKNL